MSKLTDASKGVFCIRCGKHGAYSCHYNGPRQHDYGKGRGIKCSDIATAEFCNDCDNVFSEGTTQSLVLRLYGAVVYWDTKWDRSEEFLHWCMLTNIRRFENMVLKT